MKFLTNDSVSGNLTGEETVVATVKAADLESGENTFNSKPLCSNCRGSLESKRPPIHCQVLPNGDVRVRCNNTICECRCRTHYICKDCYRLHPYGEPRCNWRDPAVQERLAESRRNWTGRHEEKEE